MNTNYNISKILAGAVCAGATLFAMPACTDGFQEDNRPGNKLSIDELKRDNYITSSFIVQMANEAFPEQENTYQMNEDLIGNYLGRYMTYANDGFAEKNFAKFNAPNGWVRYPFKDSMPKTVSAFNEIKRLTKGDGVMYAWALILKSANFLRYTDMYGPLPIGADPKNPNAYSSQEEVYKAIIKDLNSATEAIKGQLITNPNLTVAAEQDKVYGGKMAKWLKYANSLKLRIAIRISGVAPQMAKELGEQAVADGVIEKNEDNLEIAYNPNGQWKTSVEWGDSRACADIESYMYGYGDPRLSKYFSNTKTKGKRPIIGCRAGAKIGNKKIAGESYSAANVTQLTKGVWMTAAEMAFCKAEGAMLNWKMGDTPENLYNLGIKLSFDQWGAANVDNYINDATKTMASYEDADINYGGSAGAVSNITIKWEAGNDAANKERLAVQKWIAMFPDGQEGWNEIRRTGYPKVFPVAQNTGSALNVPNRIPFDQEESVQNKDNYLKAVQLLKGNDDYTTKMWWQK